MLGSLMLFDSDDPAMQISRTVLYPTLTATVLVSLGTVVTLLLNISAFVVGVSNDRDICMTVLKFKEAPIYVQVGWVGLYVGIKIREPKSCR